MPSPSYLGIGMLAVLAGGALWQRRDRRIWLLGGVGTVLAALSLRSGGGAWSPWALVDHLPLAANVVQSRCSAVIDLCAAAMVAIVVDRVRALGWSRRRGPLASPPAGAPAERRGSPAGIPAATTPTGNSLLRGIRSTGTIRAAPAAALVVAAIAIAPVAWVLAPNLPFHLQPVVVPAWFTSVAPSLAPDQVVLPYPFPTADSQSSIPWQAIVGMPYAMPGGGGPAGTVARAGAQRAGFAVLRAASVPLDPAPDATAADLGAVRRAMRAWGITEVVVPTDRDLPASSRGRGTRFAVGFFTAALGSAPVRQANAWVWRRVGMAPAPVPLPITAFAACTAGGPDLRVARCVLHTGRAVDLAP